MTLPYRVSARLAVLALVTAMLTMASTGVAAARDPGSDLERVTKSGEELVKSGSAKFRGTTTADGGGDASKVTFDGGLDFKSGAGEYSVDVAAIGLKRSGRCASSWSGA
jgi:hypothetical protein